MTDKFREFLMTEYASRVAKSESMDFTKGYYKNKIKDLSWYNSDKNLMLKHQRFLNFRVFEVSIFPNSTSPIF